MARALQLAARGLCTTTPNPRVGCVLMKNDEVLAEGWHQWAGQAHAEAHALAQAGAAAAGSTAYISLEPCAHFGRTPPCVDALIAAGVSRVVVAMEDPNPQVAGNGLQRLRAAGIRAECGLLASEAQELNIGFISRMSRGRPWLRLKTATTLDGRTALENGVSQWITGPQAREDGQRWRARACAILTGIGTVRDDDPLLNVRLPGCERQPLRVVVDSRLRLSRQARILQDEPILIATATDDAAASADLRAAGHEVWVLPDEAGQVDLGALLQRLGERGINEVHAEAGARLNAGLLRGGWVDELLLYLAPMLVGARGRGSFDLAALTRLEDATRLEIRDLRSIGDDLRIRARLRA